MTLYTSLPFLTRHASESNVSVGRRFEYKSLHTRRFFNFPTLTRTLLNLDESSNVHRCGWLPDYHPPLPLTPLLLTQRCRLAGRGN